MQLTKAQREVVNARYPDTSKGRYALMRQVVPLLVQAGGTMSASDLASRLGIDEGCLRALSHSCTDLIATGRSGYRLGVGLQEALGIAPPPAPMRKRSHAELQQLLASCQNARLVSP